MDNIEEMKKMWDELNQRVALLEEENRILAKKVVGNKFKSTKEKLIKRYTAFSLLSFIMIIYSVFFILLNPMISDQYRIVSFVSWVIFFLFEGFADLYLRHRLQGLDVYNSTLKEISAMASQNWRLHKLAIFIGLPMAILVVILFGLAMDADIFVIYGMIVGGAVGLAIGLYQLRKFYIYYKHGFGINDYNNALEE